MFCIELVNITFKQGKLGLNEIYLQFLDNVACISWGKQGNASKYFCATVEILRNCSPPRLISECKIREGYIIASNVDRVNYKGEMGEELNVVGNNKTVL